MHNLRQRAGDSDLNTENVSQATSENSQQPIFDYDWIHKLMV